MCEDGTKIYCPPDEPSLVLIQCALCGELLEKPADGACPGHVTCTPRRQWTPLSRELEFSGVSVIQEFTSLEEEKELVEAIDQEPWAESQSGRRKQVSQCYVPSKSTTTTTSNRTTDPKSISSDIK